VNFVLKRIIIIILTWYSPNEQLPLCLKLFACNSAFWAYQHDLFRLEISVEQSCSQKLSVLFWVLFWVLLWVLLLVLFSVLLLVLFSVLLCSQFCSVLSSVLLIVGCYTYNSVNNYCWLLNCFFGQHVDCISESFENVA